MTTQAKPIGILGGGQLSQMLAQAGREMGLDILVLAQNTQEPAAQVASYQLGSWNDLASLKKFLHSTSVVCFENEFAPCDILRQASEGLDLEFRPSLGALFVLQDKLRQKHLAGRLQIDTARMVEVPETDSGTAILDQAAREFPEGWVLKWARLGYDGYGTLLSGARTRIEELAFIDSARAKQVPLFIEAKVPFRRELALVAVRSRTGEWDAYPLVVSHQSGGICHWVEGPAQALGVAAALEEKAREAARKLGEALDLCGAYALEFFETTDGQLLLNEVAPRVHNTGHYTQDAAQTSQFANHLRAVLGMGLGETTTAPAFAMRNLLGPASVVTAALPQAAGQVKVHWYGKADFRPGRKLGHLNVQGASPADLPRLRRELEEVERDWHNRVHGKNFG